jgi:endonuclease YncB( thermonuclease family)
MCRPASILSFVGAPVVLRHVKRGKYFGRVVAEVIVPGGANLEEAMLNAGLARRYPVAAEDEETGR